MFLLNSRQGLFSAAPLSSIGKRLHSKGRSLSLSYGSILPNSLTKVLSFTLVFSTCLPVSVCGTGSIASKFRYFSWQHGLTTCDHFGLRIQRLRLPARFFLYGSLSYTLSTKRHLLAGLPHCVLPSLHNASTGILTCCPSPTPLGLGLGPTNPPRIDLPVETLDFRWR